MTPEDWTRIEAQRRDRENPSPIDAERLGRAMLATVDTVKWPKRWRRNAHNFDWVARQVAAAYARDQR